MYQDFPLQGPPKFTQIGMWGLKTNHLATMGGGLRVPEVNMIAQKLCMYMGLFDEYCAMEKLGGKIQFMI
jgi:hypothetical protein